MTETSPGDPEEGELDHWSAFASFTRADIEEPQEKHYLAYFKHLRKEQVQRASALWTSYNMLNEEHEKKFSKRVSAQERERPKMTKMLEKFSR